MGSKIILITITPHNNTSIVGVFLCPSTYLGYYTAYTNPVFEPHLLYEIYSRTKTLPSATSSYVFSQIDLGYLVYSLDYLIKGMQHLLSIPQTEQGFYWMSILVETLFLLMQYKGIQLPLCFFQILINPALTELIVFSNK